MPNTISTAELKQKLDNGGDVYLIDALGADSYDTRHLPGAKNVPNGPGFLEQFETEIGAPQDAEIIVYCSSDECDASREAARVLEEAGYTNVVHYKEGLVGWEAAGHPFNGAAAKEDV